MRKRLTAVIVVGLVTACQPRPGAEARGNEVRADSIVLERTGCFGYCPAYHLSLRADGNVAFASRAPRDSGRVMRDSIAPGEFAWLVQEANRSGFFALPPVIGEDKSLCRVMATDHPTVSVAIFHGDSTSRVVDYRGCYAGTDLSLDPRLAKLRHFEAQVDSVARSERWTSAMRRP